MKKIVCLFLSLLIAISLVACTFEIKVPENNDANDLSSSLSDLISNTEKNDSSDNETTDADNKDNTEESTPDDNKPAENKTEWKDFLKEYEAWVDDYITFMNKYKANPTDLSLLSDYAKLSAKAIEWSTKAEQMQTELSGDDLNEYIQTMARISQKLSAIAY